MAVYAVGDLQGCYEPLQRLLDLLRFDPATDVLWLVGDLVNQGASIGGSVTAGARPGGAGGHRIRQSRPDFISMMTAGAVKPKRKDTFYSEFDAPDGAELVDWLRGRPMLHHDPTLGFTAVHADLPPQWDLSWRAGARRSWKRLCGERNIGNFWRTCSARNPGAGAIS